MYISLMVYVYCLDFGMAQFPILEQVVGDRYPRASSTRQDEKLQRESSAYLAKLGYI